MYALVTWIRNEMMINSLKRSLRNCALVIRLVMSIAHVIHTGWCDDDVVKWKHFPRNCPFVRGIRRSPVNSPHKDQWCGALMFSLICASINRCANNREAGDLRHHHKGNFIWWWLGCSAQFRLSLFNVNEICVTKCWKKRFSLQRGSDLIQIKS